MSSNIARGDILRAGIINHSLALLRALLGHGYYSREGLKVLDFLRSTQNLKKSSSWFVRLLSKCTKHDKDCANFCVLLRKSKL